MLQDFIGDHALLGQAHRPPLGKSLAGSGGAAAVLGEIGLHRPLLHHVIIEDIVHDMTDVFIDIPVFHKALVIAGGAGDIEIIALAGIPLGVKRLRA